MRHPVSSSALPRSICHHSPKPPPSAHQRLLGSPSLPKPGSWPSCEDEAVAGLPLARFSGTSTGDFGSLACCAVAIGAGAIKQSKQALMTVQNRFESTRPTKEGEDLGE